MTARDGDWWGDRDMEQWEGSSLLQEEKEDEETLFYQEAFQDFDWNNSGRISTSVSSSK